jgi:hypothetical protein
MPLTIAHPAAVLPLRRLGLPLTALIAGSMSPDLEHFFYFSPQSYVSHSLPGLFLFCLPAGALLLWVFQRLWLPAAALLIPLPAHLAEPERGSVARVGLGLLLGAVTHIAWDAFTHEYGFAVINLPILRSTLMDGTWHSMVVYKILQHGSSLLGLGILGLAALHHRREWPVIRPRLLVILSLALGAAALTAVDSVMLQYGIPPALRGITRYIGNVIVRFACISLAALTAVSIFSQILEERHRRLFGQGKMKDGSAGSDSGRINP